MDSSHFTAFDGHKFFHRGPLEEVVTKIKKSLGKSENNSIQIFSDLTGNSMDFNFQGSLDDVLKRLEIFVSPPPEASTGPGRPKLGVVSREISLLPRHWEWLATQPGGASGTIRKLIEDAKRKTEGQITPRQAQERANKFMSLLTGDLPNYEEALRALYRKDKDLFCTHIQSWPKDVRVHLLYLTNEVF